jgi:hypothetical protein
MKRKSNLIFAVLLLIPFLSFPQKVSDQLTSAAAPAILIEEGNVDYESFFQDKTMRLDYYHSGSSKEEHFAVDQIVADGKWPGSKTILMDPLELGLYFFEVRDKESDRILYSRGFASVFGEWQSTPEADKEWGTYHESLRFPWPLKTVTIVLKKRDSENTFQTIWITEINPLSRKVNPADMIPTHKVDVLVDNGPASRKVDIVILGDGYSRTEMEKFRKDSKRLTDVLLSHEPFKSRVKDFNIRAVETPAEESGVFKPHPGVFRRTPLSVHYGSFDSERYALTYDNRTIRDVASEVPYDFMVILINERTYGGGGIYNLYTTVSADNKFADYIMVHELGHHMAGLADEYYTSSVSYEAPGTQVEPWEVNITALKDLENLKWKELVEHGTPIPTPWNKDVFDKFGYSVQKQRDSLRAARVPENVMEDLFLKQKNQEDIYFASEEFKDKTGAFEGAGYMQYGLYRSQLDCIMYTRHMNFCTVCRKGLESVFDIYCH